MIRLFRWSVLTFTFMLAPALFGQEKPAEKPASPWLVDRALTVQPQAEPTPALKYRLLPLSSSLREGNAVPIYLRLAHEQSDATRKHLTETAKPWNALPIDKIPLGEARQFLHHRHYPYQLRQLELGARRRTAEWGYTLEEPNPIGLLLPDVQWMRNYEPILTLQARVALAEGNFSAAAHHLETGFAFCRHVGDGPTLIHKLVALALVRQFAGVVADFIERPDAPNLYWSLTALPRPLIDLRGPLEWEYSMVEMQIPELADTDRERTPEEWERALQRVRTSLRGLWGLYSEGPAGNQMKLPDWFPKHCDPAIAAANSPELPAARAYLARTRKRAADKVAAMPAAQALLLYIKETYDEDRDDWYRFAYLPYPQARPLFEASMKRLRTGPITEAHLPARALLSGLDRVMANQVTLERNLTALRVVEALRIYAAAHDGKLPEKLDDVTEVPIPNDPGTDRPFEYHRDGETASVVSKIPDESAPNSGVRYQVTIRKK